MPDLICTGLDGGVQRLIDFMEWALRTEGRLTLCCGDHDFAAPNWVSDWVLFFCWMAQSWLMIVIGLPALIAIPIWRALNRRT